MMSIFKLPDSLLDDIHSMMANFWWGSTNENRKTHWHSWVSMCVPKSQGGMGFRDLKCFNQALLVKQAWRLHEEADSMVGSIFKARYYKHSGFLAALRGYDPSFAWRSIWGAKSVLLEGLCWRVGNGWSINALQDKWVLVDGHMQAPVARNHPPYDMMVGELIDQELMHWHIDLVRDTFDQDSAEAMLAIPLSKWDCGDTLYWLNNKNGRYSVRSGYWLARSIHPRHSTAASLNAEHIVWKKIWNLNGPPKLKHLLWRGCKNSLPVNDVRKHRHLAESELCTRCSMATETLHHAIFECPSHQNMWLAHPCQRLISDAPNDSFMDFIQWLIAHASGEEFILVCASFWAC